MKRDWWGQVHQRVGRVKESSQFLVGEVQRNLNMSLGDRLFSGAQRKTGGVSRVQQTKVFGAEGEDI